MPGVISSAMKKQKGKNKMENTIKIYVGTYAKYASGSIAGEWLALPMDDDNLAEALKRIAGNEASPEYMIQAYQADFRIDEACDIKTLNAAARGLVELDEEQREIFIAELEQGEDFFEALDIAESGDKMAIFADTEQELAEIEVENSGGIENLSREILERYFDFSAFGRDLAIQSHKTENAYVF